MTVGEKLLSVEEFSELPDDGRKYELIEGVLVEVTGAKPKHSKIAALIAQHLLNHVQPDDLGLVGIELGCVLNRETGTVIFADVAYVSKERLGNATLDEYIPVAPDIAVEIVSPTDIAEAVMNKTKSYFDAGTRLLWLIYPSTLLVQVYRALDDVHVEKIDGALDGEAVLPGFRLPLRVIFS